MKVASLNVGEKIKEVILQLMLSIRYNRMSDTLPSSQDNLFLTFFKQLEDRISMLAQRDS